MKIWQATTSPTRKIPLLPDRHLITCLIANHVQGNNTPHPGTVLSSFLQHLAQLILLIIVFHDTDDAPPFLHHPKIYNLEFWHAHLNCAYTRFATSHGSNWLLGNQICHWTKGTSETCMQVTHLVVFLAPALGAYVLSQHHTKVSSSLSSADGASHARGPTHSPDLLTLPAVISRQAEQIANARRRAAEGSLAPHTILLAHTQTRSSKNRVTWLSNSRCQRPQLMALPAIFPQFRGGMAQAAHMPSKRRCVTLTPSTTTMKPQHFSPTLTSSPCLITLPNMAQSGLKLLDCTSQIPLENGFSPAPLASIIARPSTFLATATLLFRPSLSATFVANSPSFPPQCPAGWRWHRYSTSLARCTSFWEVRGWPTTRAQGNAPVEEKQPDSEKRQDVLVERTI